MTTGLVLIDDTGTPGQRSDTDYLDPSRITWVGLVIEPAQAFRISEELPGYLSEFRKLTGLEEFHSADLYSGKGCRDTPWEVRLGVVAALAQIFQQERFKALVQTVDNRTMADLKMRGIAFPEVLGPFRMSDRPWFALLLLLAHIKKHMLEVNRADQFKATFYVDEGLRRPGDLVKTYMLHEVSPDDSLHFASSLDFPPLQLADFAAFALNRMQWAMSRSELSERDTDLLYALQPLQDAFANLNKWVIDPSAWTSSDYEAMIDKDRLEKGLPPTTEMDL